LQGILLKLRIEFSNIKVIKDLVNRDKDQADREIKFRKILGSNMPIPLPAACITYANNGLRLQSSEHQLNIFTRGFIRKEKMV
tara:strand:+ start:251 stop:499 length:249 start_codon:yes stop_codon:yes gene_type:complete